MRIRTGFVSNSSSSSFIIPKSALTSIQIYLIKNYLDVAKGLLELDPPIPAEDREELEYAEGNTWSISETAHSIKGYTSMDNFSMRHFLKMIGVPMEEVEFEGGGW